MIEQLRARLQQPLPGLSAQERMTGRVLPMPEEVPASARPSAVLFLLFGNEAAPNLLLIQRTADGRAHSGQISAPGGRWEPADADLRTTALRETEEEVGIAPKDVDVLGSLTPLYIPISNFLVHPFVGYAPVLPTLSPSAHEVHRTLEVSLDTLFNPATKIITEVRPISAPGLVLNVPAYRLEDSDSIIWGATAMMLAELEEVMHEARA
jgi:8-oxo-dGTP pyrophosphatase MutT (NUDIX family)